VYQRIIKFVLDLEQPIPDDLPSETTREWAGNLAASTLASVQGAVPAGMNRFVKNWWPGTPTPELWSMWFGAEGNGTLVYLFTSPHQRSYGAGPLTDPTVLSLPFITARGNLIDSRVLCNQPFPSDPSTVTPLPPGETRRSELERIEATDASCASCHKPLDPFGFALQNFATDGTFRTTENGLPLDTTAVLRLPQTGDVAVLDAQSMGNALANSCEAALCFTQQLLHDASVSAQLPREASLPEVAQIADQFARSGLILPGLVRLVVESDPFLSAN
jgi:hypothetical protein